MSDRGLGWTLLVAYVSMTLQEVACISRVCQAVILGNFACEHVTYLCYCSLYPVFQQKKYLRGSLKFQVTEKPAECVDTQWISLYSFFLR